MSETVRFPLAWIVACAGLAACGGAQTAPPAASPRPAPEPPPPPAFVQVAVGEEHACALHDDGRVFCWGYNADGRAAPDLPARRIARPRPVPGITRATAIAVAAETSCAVVDGLVACWGDDGFGRAIPASRSHALPEIPGVEWLAAPAVIQNPAIGEARQRCDVTGYLQGAQGLIAGHESFCASTDDGLFCWGRSVRAIAGDVPPLEEGGCPVAVEVPEGARRHALGRELRCALVGPPEVSSPERGVVCFGDDAFGAEDGAEGGYAPVLVRDAEAVAALLGGAPAQPPGLHLDARRVCLTAPSGAAGCFAWEDRWRASSVPDVPAHRGAELTAGELCLFGAPPEATAELGEGPPPGPACFDLDRETWNTTRFDAPVEPGPSAHDGPDCTIAALDGPPGVDYARLGSRRGVPEGVRCARCVEGAVLCWGNGARGALGAGEAREVDPGALPAVLSEGEPADAPRSAVWAHMPWSSIGPPGRAPEGEALTAPADGCPASLEMGRGPVVLTLRSRGMERIVRMPRGYWHRGPHRSEIRLGGLRFLTAAAGPPRADGWTQLGLGVPRSMSAGREVRASLMIHEASLRLGCFPLPPIRGGTLRVASLDGATLAGAFRSNDGRVEIAFEAEVGSEAQPAPLDPSRNRRAAGGVYLFDARWSGERLRGVEEEGQVAFTRGYAISDLGLGYLVFVGFDRHGRMIYEMDGWTGTEGLTSGGGPVPVSWASVTEVGEGLEAWFGSGPVPDTFEGVELDSFRVEARVDVPTLHRIPRIEVQRIEDAHAPVRRLAALSARRAPEAWSSGVWVAASRADAVSRDCAAHEGATVGELAASPEEVERRTDCPAAEAIRAVDASGAPTVWSRRRQGRRTRRGVETDRRYRLDPESLALRSARLTPRLYVGPNEVRSWPTDGATTRVEAVVGLATEGDVVRVDHGGDGDWDAQLAQPAPLYPVDALALVISEAELAPGDLHDFASFRVRPELRHDGQGDEGRYRNPRLAVEVEPLRGRLSVGRPVRFTVAGARRRLVPVRVRIWELDEDRGSTRVYYRDAESGAVLLWRDADGDDPFLRVVSP
ncbi:MAG TPA: RCC1 domain-containing protein [Sandaracinaceae bacterium LLY-WYZ-13_1]|nr:RCC1 domain-containing protein [Sandaracinaceae bacterium LLY-WYZ-13_1]